ncbi:DUF1990 family protein [Nocardioides daeguensis]|uniref:DUF1990 domain-containing protein n=1 Tax=Nocardioides daeguensis TaxID=908359 RepID=A0ABP6UXN9_9ACTN|nr:DUF1990 domain-containing protein [Nocardioides daeguensis]MCR1774825.1 DUF1990 domain-containing protein [Nocardioides daeguensis]
MARDLPSARARPAIPSPARSERFLLEQHPAGTITLTITAFSRPASRLAVLGGPFTRMVQQGMTSRYLRALDRL